MAGPFKMKGNPMQRNFGIGSPVSPVKKTYKEAYADADKSKYKTEAEFTKAAKDYNREKYGTTEPTADSKKGGMSKSELAKKHKASTTTSKAVNASEATDALSTHVNNTKQKGDNAAPATQGPKTKKETRATTPPKTAIGNIGRKISNYMASKAGTPEDRANFVAKPTKKSVKKQIIKQGVEAGLTKKEAKGTYKTAKKSVKTDKKVSKIKATADVKTARAKYGRGSDEVKAAKAARRKNKKA